MKKKMGQNDIDAIVKPLADAKQLSDSDFENLIKAKKEDFIVRHLMIQHNFTDLLFLDSRLKSGRGAILFEESFWGKDILYIARSEEPILIVGETGTGKEVMAELLHSMSKRRKQKMVRTSCIELPETLIESELFGYKQGSFTGAKHDKKGLLEQAGNTTLFLDEIGKMPQPTQAKLLRVVETKKFYPIGSVTEQDTNFRIIAAVQPGDLEEKKIIPDLLYRLGYPYRIKIPPLRERLKKDKGFPSRVLGDAIRIAKKVLGISKNQPYYIPEDAYDILIKHSFEGNYRELLTVLKFAILRAQSDNRDMILPEDLDFIKPSTPALDDINTIPLKDIFEYADRKAAAIIEEKVKHVLRSGKDIKNTLIDEGYTATDVNFRKMVKKRINKSIRDITKEI